MLGYINIPLAMKQVLEGHCRCLFLETIYNLIIQNHYLYAGEVLPQDRVYRSSYQRS